MTLHLKDLDHDYNNLDEHLNCIKKLMRAVPRLDPQYSVNIIYRSGYWDGILSGTMRWNGGLFHFTRVADEDGLDWPWYEYDGEIDVSRNGLRYYAVLPYTIAGAKTIIRDHLIFRKFVGYNSDYRKQFAGRSLRPQSEWGKYYDRPKTKKDLTTSEVVAWFRF